AIPSAVFFQPPIGQVGLGEQQNGAAFQACTVHMNLLETIDVILIKVMLCAFLESASIRPQIFSRLLAALHEFKFICIGLEGSKKLSFCELKEEAADVYRLVGKWLAEIRSSNSIPSAVFFQPPIGQVGLGERRVTGTAVPAITMIFFGDVQDR
ncbi:hypothetical protein Tco_0818539, partial [Tanacetum coccineum]